LFVIERGGERRHFKVIRAPFNLYASVRAWEHTASPVAPGMVKSIRTETAQREEGWTQAELLKIQ
jgi:hypothetical protein